MQPQGSLRFHTAGNPPLQLFEMSYTSHNKLFITSCLLLSEDDCWRRLVGSYRYCYLLWLWRFVITPFMFAFICGKEKQVL